MTPEEKAREICSRNAVDCDHDCQNCVNQFELANIYEMAEWKEEQLQEAKSLLRECYNTILGITSIDSPEDIAKARSTHDSSLIKRIESFMYNNQ